MALQCEPKSLQLNPQLRESDLRLPTIAAGKARYTFDSWWIAALPFLWSGVAHFDDASTVAGVITKVVSVKIPYLSPLQVVRNMVFFELFFLLFFTTRYVVSPLPRSFLSSFTHQEKTIRVLLIP